MATFWSHGKARDQSEVGKKSERMEELEAERVVGWCRLVWVVSGPLVTKMVSRVLQWRQRWRLAVEKKESGIDETFKLG